MMNVKMCPKFEAAFTLLGKRWTGLIIRAILFGQHRFSDIAHSRRAGRTCLVSSGKTKGGRP